MSARTLVFCLLVAACTSPVPAPSPPKTMADDDAEDISGTIESIRFQNINKALDHYTYNVELVVARPDADPITVRVDKLYWSTMTQAQRDAVAPEGPQQELRPRAWRDWNVGDAVTLRVRVTSPGLAHLVR